MILGLDNLSETVLNTSYVDISGFDGGIWAPWISLAAVAVLLGFIALVVTLVERWSKTKHGK